MKTLFCLILLISGFSVFGQTSDSTQVYFKGGANKLEYAIDHYFSKHHRFANLEVNIKFNRYITVLLRLDKSAHLEDMAVFSVGDSAFTSDSLFTNDVSTAIRETEGNWVNSTGQLQQILIPVYFISYQDKNVMQPLPILAMKLTMFRDGKIVPFIFFHPIILNLYPAMN